MKIKWLCALVLGLIICLPGMAGATFISDPTIFGAGTVTEGFEDIITTTPNTSGGVLREFYPPWHHFPLQLRQWYYLDRSQPTFGYSRLV